VPERFPGHGLARLRQHRVRVLERPGPGQARVGADPHAVELDLGLPQGPVGGLACDPLGPVAGHRVRRAVGVLDDERADVAVGHGGTLQGDGQVGRVGATRTRGER
jgi:hypothetical protein